MSQEDLNSPLNIKKTTLKLTSLTVDTEKKRIHIRGVVGNTDSSGAIIDGEWVKADIKGPSPEYDQALDLILPSAGGVRQAVNTGARKVLKKMLELKHGLTPDSL